MNCRLHLALGVAVLCFGVGCGTARTKRASLLTGCPLPPARSPVECEGAAAAVARTATVTTNAPPARALPKWNPIWWFGNVDDPVPPDWYRPGSPSRGWLWQLRNPLHNFTFYVIGFADKPFTRTGRFPKAVFAPDGGWNWAVSRHGWVRLPFISFNGEWGRFYFGWRERGNFGFKINLGKLPAADPKTQTKNPITK